MIKFIIFAVIASGIYMQLQKSANKSIKDGEIDYFPLIGAILVTVLCTLIVLLSVIMADKVAEPIQYALGGTSNQVQEASVVRQFEQKPSIILLGMPILFIVAYTLFRYLGDGFMDYGFWTLPRKDSRY